MSSDFNYQALRYLLIIIEISVTAVAWCDIGYDIDSTRGYLIGRVMHLIRLACFP
jgi:hypothetical protein